jgi:glutaredoxin
VKLSFEGKGLKRSKAGAEVKVNIKINHKEETVMVMDKHSILILGKDGCKACEEAKDYLYQRFSDEAIVVYSKFKDLPVETRRSVTKQLKETAKESNKNVDITYPIIFIDGYVMFGFSRKFFEQ